MSEKNDIRALNEAALDLYNRASRMQSEGGIRAKDAAHQLRLQADNLLSQAASAIDLSHRDATAENRIRNIASECEKLAREIRFSFETFRAMKDAGTIQLIANDLGSPIESLEHYVARSIIKHQKAALRIQMAKKVKVPNLSEPGQKTDLKRLLLLGISQTKIEQHLGISKKRMHVAIQMLTEAEKTERSLAIQARRRKRHAKVFELRNKGHKLSTIASRTGYSRSHIAQILSGGMFCSADLHGNTNFHK